MCDSHSVITGETGNTTTTVLTPTSSPHWLEPRIGHSSHVETTATVDLMQDNLWRTTVCQ